MSQLPNESAALLSFLKEQQQAVEDLERQSALAMWEASVTGSPEHEERAATLSARLIGCYADAERYDRLRQIAKPEDHDLSRQRRLLLDSFAGSQMAPDVIEELARRGMEVETLFGNFRANLAGKPATDNQVRDILRQSGDSAQRREAWEASKQVGEIAAPKVLELVALRNQEARRLGYPDYYVMQIRLQELEEGPLFTLLEDVSESLQPLFRAYKLGLDEQLAMRFKVDTGDLRPWHYADPFFQSAPEPEEVHLDSYFEGKSLEEITARFFSQIGLDIGPILARSDLYEKPGKSQHAFCTHVGRETRDVRVLCNIRPNAQWMQIMLHEFGHASYDNELDPQLPFFLKDVAHIMTTEAIAELMGRFANNGAWLCRWAGVPPQDAARIEQATRQTHRAHMLIFTQWVQVMAHFERAFYADPAQDLNTLWWELVEKHQLVPRPDGRDLPDWAANIHLATNPAYYHNYLLGELTASQILHTLRAGVVKSDEDLVASPAVGAWLTENIFRQGARYSWNDLLARATGEPLNPRYFVEELMP